MHEVMTDDGQDIVYSQIETDLKEQNDGEPNEAVIEAPSAAEVTAALEALGAGSAGFSSY